MAHMRNGLGLAALGWVAVVAVSIAQDVYPIGQVAAESDLNNTPTEVSDADAAWFRIAALTVAVDAALEALRFEHRCRPFGSAPSTEEQRRFAAYALEEALIGTRLMWPHVLALSPLLARQYWPLRYRLGQIARAPIRERSELVCRPDLHLIRSRWNLALKGTTIGHTPPFEWSSLQRMGVLRRVGSALDRSVRTTCHSVGDPQAALTTHMAQRLVIEHAVGFARASFRSVPGPTERERGASLLWAGIERALSDWTSAMDRSLQDGARRHSCGHMLWHVLWGTYYTWLDDAYEQPMADKLDLLLHWTQLEIGLHQLCLPPDLLTRSLIGDSIEQLLASVGSVGLSPLDLRIRRDEVAAEVYDWLPSAKQVRSLQYDDLACPGSQRESVSQLLTDVADLTATD